MMKYLEFFGGCFAFVLDLGRMTGKKNLVSRILSIIYLCIGASQFRLFFDEAITIRNLRILFPILSILTASAVTVHLYIEMLISPHIEESRHYHYWFIPIVFALLTDCILIFLNLLWPAFFGGVIGEILHWTGGIFLLVSLSVGIIRLFSLFSLRQVKAPVLFAFIFSVYVVIAVLCGLAGLAFGISFLENLSTILFVILLVFIFLATEIFNELVMGFTHEINQNRYKKSSLAGVDKNRLKADLLDLIKKEKPYLNEQCNLKNLASMLNLRSHQLSEFLNNDLNMGFSVFINKYRIEYAKTLLVKDKEKNVLEIAYETRFGNKTSFNKVFKEMTGSTPLQFRNISLKNA